MSNFKVNDEAEYIGVDGTERRVRVVGNSGTDYVHAHVIDEDETVRVRRAKLMRVRGAFFDIRGQVYTTSPSHPVEIGEIIALGKSKSNKQFYKVKFADEKVEWFNEDQIFIETAISDK